MQEEVDDMSVVVVTERFVAATGSPPYTQDLITTKLGGLTPKAAIFWVVRADTDGVAEDDAAKCWGVATSPTNRFCLHTLNSDNRTISDVLGVSHDARVIELLYKHTPPNINAAADINSFITNGVRLDWEVSPIYGPPLIQVIFFAGDGVQAYHGVEEIVIGSEPDTYDVTGVGFEPDLVFHACIMGLRDAEDSTSLDQLVLGVSHNDGEGGITEFCNVSYAPDAKDPVQMWGRHRIGALFGLHHSDGTYWFNAKTQDYDSDGFTYNVEYTWIAQNITAAVYLAFKFTDREAAVFEFSTPISTGQDAYTGLSWTPQIVGMFPGGAEARETIYGDNRAGTHGVAVFDGTDEFCTTSSGEDETPTWTNTQTLSDDRAIAVPDDDGVLLQEATFVTMRSDGFMLDWSNVHSTPKLYPAWAIQGEVTDIVPGTRLNNVGVGEL